MEPVQIGLRRRVAEIGLLNWNSGSILLIFPWKFKNSTTQIHKIIFSPDPGNLLNLVFRNWPRSGEF